MRKLVLFGYGNFGQAMLDSALALGIEPDADTFALDGTDILEFRRNLDSICNTVYNKDEILLLCDSESGSMTQEACLVLEKRGLISKMILVAGISVPTVLAAIAWKDRITDSTQLQNTLKAESQSGLKFFGR